MSSSKAGKRITVGTHDHSKLGKVLTVNILHTDELGESVVVLNTEAEWEFLLSKETTKELIKALEEQLEIAEENTENKSLAW